MIILLTLLLVCDVCFANDDIIKIRTVNAIIGEAEGETYKGKLGVACAIINRVGTHGSFDKAMSGVYGEKSKRVTEHKYSNNVFVDAVRAYEESLEVGSCDFIDGADHWEGVSFNKPSWSKDMIMTARVGKQIFYKAKE